MPVGVIHYFGLTSLPMLRVAYSLFFVDNTALLLPWDAALWIWFMEGDESESFPLDSPEITLGLVPKSSSTNIYRYANKRKIKAKKSSKQQTPNKEKFNY